jgi:Zn finger protein HypA/HybF involved in hydrogenase expression
MARLLARLAVVALTLAAAALAGGSVLGAASAETRVTELLVTCLSCGERWLFVPSASVAAGFLSVFRRRKLVDTCPKCGSRAVAFAHAEGRDKADGHDTDDYGRTA